MAPITKPKEKKKRLCWLDLEWTKSETVVWFRKHQNLKPGEAGEQTELSEAEGDSVFSFLALVVLTIGWLWKYCTYWGCQLTNTAPSDRWLWAVVKKSAAFHCRDKEGQTAGNNICLTLTSHSSKFCTELLGSQASSAGRLANFLRAFEQSC